MTDSSDSPETNASGVARAITWVFIAGVGLLVLFTLARGRERVSVVGPSMFPTYREGDSLVVLPVTIRGLERFDVVVVEHNEKKYVKRVLGLPGETIEFRNGDLVIDGNVVSTTDALGWQEVGSWKSLPAEPWIATENGIAYAKPIFAANWLHADTPASTRVTQEDVRLRLKLMQVSDSSRVSIGIRHSAGDWIMVFGKGGRPLPTGETVSLAMQVRDGLLSAFLNGEPAGRLPVTKKGLPEGPLWETPIRIGLSDGVLAGDVTLERDLYYFAPRSGSQKWSCKRNEFFVVGDNPFNSTDSRQWGPLHADSLIGKIEQ